MNARAWFYSQSFHGNIPLATKLEPESEIQPCGHFDYRAYWNAPDDYGCAGCDNDMPPDAEKGNANVQPK